MKKHRTRRGRPPAGARPGERVVDYPQLSLRVPRNTLWTLRAVSDVTGEAQWRVLSDAVDRYIDRLPEHQGQLVSDLLRRAKEIFEQPAKRQKAARKPARPILVLNVDDHEPMLFARSAMLRREGWEVLEARTGRAALDILRRHRPDV